MSNLTGSIRVRAIRLRFLIIFGKDTGASSAVFLFSFFNTFYYE